MVDGPLHLLHPKQQSPESLKRDRRVYAWIVIEGRGEQWTADRERISRSKIRTITKREFSRRHPEVSTTFGADAYGRPNVNVDQMRAFEAIIP